MDEDNLVANKSEEDIQFEDLRTGKDVRMTNCEGGENSCDEGAEAMKSDINGNGNVYEGGDYDGPQTNNTPSSLGVQEYHDIVTDIGSSSAGSIFPVPLEDPFRHASPLFSAATGAFMQHDEITIVNHYSTAFVKQESFGSVTDEQAYVNPPPSNSPLNLSNLPLDIKVYLMNSMDPILATVLGLTCGSLYVAYWKFYHNLQKYPQKIKLTDGIFLKCPNCDLIKLVQLSTLLSGWAPPNYEYNKETGRWVKLRFPLKHWGVKYKNMTAIFKAKVNNNKVIVKFKKIAGIKNIG